MMVEGGDNMKVTTAERLKEIMKKRGLRQADVLRMAEPYSRTFGIPLNRANLSMYVTGKVVPVQDKLFLLARTLDVSEAWLMGLDVPEASEPEAKNLANSVVDLMQLNGDDIYQNGFTIELKDKGKGSMNVDGTKGNG